MVEAAMEDPSTWTLAEKLRLFAGQATIAETVGMLSSEGYNRTPVPGCAVPSRDFPGIRFSDGPRGVVMGRSTCFPVAMARGASWDTDLETRIGAAIGRECRAQGGNFWAGVCVNVVRHPAWGRAQESYGEDPVLLGRMGCAVIRGAQQHVMACVKHFALNNVERSRFHVDAQVDERTLHEVYLPHFRACVDAGVASVMSAYNRVNGDHCGESAALLTGILRDQWGFDGFVVSDFMLGVRDGIRGFAAGLDVEMPMRLRFLALPRGIRSRRITRARVDQAANAIVRTVRRFESVPRAAYPDMASLRIEHAPLAREAAQKAMVLLRNEAVQGTPVLPLDPHGSAIVAVVGARAKAENLGDHGSSRVHPANVCTLSEGLAAGLGAARFVFDTGEDVQGAARVAARAHTAVVVVGYGPDDEGEYIPPRSGDRRSLRLSRADEALIEAVAAVQPRTVVVLVTGSAVVTPWSDRVAGLLVAWYPGQEGGRALWDVLSGAVDPGGRLPLVFPADAAHTPFFSPRARRLRVDAFHGYRLLDRDGLTPRFAFGFGLSYTRFDVSAPTTTPSSEHGGVRVSVSTRNTGSRAGSTVIQAYARLPREPAPRPIRALRDFVRVSLPAGASQTVDFEVSPRWFAHYRPATRDWHTRAGTVDVEIGTSSRPEDLHTVSLTVPEQVFPR